MILNLNYEQKLKIAGRIGHLKDDELDSELTKIYGSIKQMEDIKEIFHFCYLNKLKYKVYIIYDRLIVSINNHEVNLEFKTLYDVFEISTNY